MRTANQSVIKKKKPHQEERRSKKKDARTTKHLTTQTHPLSSVCVTRGHRRRRRRRRSCLMAQFIKKVGGRGRVTPHIWAEGRGGAEEDTNTHTYQEGEKE